MKIKRICMTAFLLLLFVSLVGCKPAKQEAPEDDLKKDVLLADFEEWAPSFQTIKFMNGFGRISKNEDKQFVMSGNSSARLDPLGWAGGGNRPLLFFPTYSNLFGYNYSNFLYADRITMDMYNDCGEDKTFNMGLVNSINDINNITRINDKQITVRPGWNQVALQVDASQIAINGDITNVKGIYLMFDNAKSPDVTDDTPRYYIDDLKIVKKNSENATDFRFVLDEGEIVDFERSYQKYCISHDFEAEISVVKASDYTVKDARGNEVTLQAPSGEKVLRVKYGGEGTGSWRYWKIDAKLIGASMLKGLAKEDYDDTYICFEVYNNFTSPTAPATFNTTLDYTVGANESKRLSTSCQAVKGEWFSYEYKLSNILKIHPTFTENPGAFMIWYADTEGEKEFFYDDFRVEIRK